MSIAATITGRSVLGDKRVTWGTYTDSSASTVDDINTGLRSVEVILLQPGGSTVSANAPSVNETLPTAGATVSIIADASQTGYWFAIGT